MFISDLDVSIHAIQTYFFTIFYLMMLYSISVTASDVKYCESRCCHFIKYVIIASQIDIYFVSFKYMLLTRSSFLFLTYSIGLVGLNSRSLTQR